MLRLPERIHKRPFIVAIIVFLVFIVAASVMLIVFGFLGTGSNLVRLHLYSAGEGTKVNGIGLNLSYIPTTNFLENPSFEDVQYDQIYTVFEGTENAVYALPDSDTEANLEDRIFVGGSIRVVSIDENGQLVQKLQASVTDFQMDQLGQWTTYEAPIGTRDNQMISSISTSERVSVAFGQNGLLISDVTSSAPTIIDLGFSEDITASSCVLDRFFAVTATGDFTTSSDGKTWSLFSPENPVLSSVRTVTSIGKTGIAAGDQGQMLLFSEGVISTVASGTTDNILTSASDGSVVILGCSGGQVLTTSNGVIMRQLTATEMPSFTITPDWLCADYRNGKYLLGGDRGQIAFGNYTEGIGFSFTAHQANDPTGNPISIRDMMILPSGELMIVDTTGLLYFSKDQGDTWNPLSSASANGIDAIGFSPTGKILLSQGTTTYATQMYTRIEFDDVQSENVFQAGDMCFLQCTVPSENGTALESSFNIWEPFGEDTTVQTQQNAPSGGGASSLLMMGGLGSTGDQEHYISQVIFDTGDSLFQKSKFYKIEVWLKQDGIANGEVMAWISGNFASVGTTFTDVGSGWRQYTYTFVLPDEACDKNAGEIRLNIGFMGEGKLSMDRTYLGLDNYSASSLPDLFTEKINGAAPSLIRLENLGIGQKGVSAQAWLLSAGNEGVLANSDEFVSAGCTSLETSLSLVRSAGSDPWLVIGSSASQTTVENLMAYLCGSISDPFGKMRIENGTAVPWGTQFDRIVIEISDADGVFSTDLQRGAYVDYIMNIIKSSPFYYDIKGRIVFVDGMEYEGGTMQSQADYHTSDLQINNQKQTETGLQMLSLVDAVSEGYTAYFDLIPRMPSRPQESGEEWIRSVQSSIFKNSGDARQTDAGTPKQITAADYCEMMLADLGDHTSTILFDLTVSKYAEDMDTERMFSSQETLATDHGIVSQNSETMLAVCSTLGDILNETSSYGRVGALDANKAVPMPPGLTAYAFQGQEKIHLIIMNTSDQTASFVVEADGSLNGAYAYRYSSEGKFVQKNKLGRQLNRINLLIGQIIIVEISA